LVKRHLPIAGLFAIALAVCGSATQGEEARGGVAPKTPRKQSATGERASEREAMVRVQLERRDIEDGLVLAAMRKVPRHLFVPEDVRRHAYGDHPLPIGHDVTISQPYIVALMSELSGAKKGSRVLEVGTGSGYQAAVLHEMGADVYSIEIIKPLATHAKQLLARLGYDRIHVRHGDGYAGWVEHAPFDAIVVTAAPPRVPAPLKQQLKVGGRLVIPVGRTYQELVVITRTSRGFRRRSVIPVRFVPMTGAAQGQ
jgi:protein-L-isoaspartate(D-aspartate) O-methyltransferase